MSAEDFTPAAARALAAAADRAAEAPASEPWFLLLELIAEDEGKAADLLAVGGLATAAVRDRLAGHAPHPSPPGTLASTVDLARELARDLAGEPHARTDHLLLALLRTDDGLLGLLMGLGLNFAALEESADAARIPPLALAGPVTWE